MEEYTSCRRNTSRALSDLHPVEAMHLLTKRLKKSRSNVEFLGKLHAA
jgi:hypothetical protein